jgi:hypothetical protein
VLKPGKIKDKSLKIKVRGVQGFLLPYQSPVSRIEKPEIVASAQPQVTIKQEAKTVDMKSRTADLPNT